jgi:hypothetical protein
LISSGGGSDARACAVIRARPPDDDPDATAVPLGSSGTQPIPATATSGQASTSLLRTTTSVPAPSAARNPTATRAGMPTIRASTTYAVANCSLVPRLLSSRNVRSAGQPLPVGNPGPLASW